jgi:hypothetical protein
MGGSSKPYVLFDVDLNACLLSRSYLNLTIGIQSLHPGVYRARLQHASLSRSASTSDGGIDAVISMTHKHLFLLSSFLV